MSEILEVVGEGSRFEFGKNWLSFLELVNEDRIKSACDSLLEHLPVTALSGRTFLDVGCGSGLFSLAAHQLGARVRSFDYDSQSVRAATELRRRFAPDSDWIIEQGSILDLDFVSGLGAFDVVYAWGVLHHTGDLWQAIDVSTRLVAPGGWLYVSVYNDQGRTSERWCWVKRRYVASGPVTRAVLVAGSAAYLYRRWPLSSLHRAIRRPAGTSAQSARRLAMSRRHDLIDWVGGYPFEVAKPEKVFAFVRARGFELCDLKSAGGGLGCNEYVFRSSSSSPRNDAA